MWWLTDSAILCAIFYPAAIVMIFALPKGFLKNLTWIANWYLQTKGMTVRACLVSFENNADKSQRKHLERILQKPFTIFPKSATLIDPTKWTFNNPTLWNNRKGVQFIAFYDLNLSFRNSFYFIGKILSCIASVNKNFFYKRKIIGYIAIIVNRTKPCICRRSETFSTIS